VPYLLIGTDTDLIKMRFQSNYILRGVNLLAALLFVLLITRCTGNENPPSPPPDPEEIRRDSIIKVLITDISSDSIKANVRWLESFGTRFALASNRRKVAVSIRDRFIRNGITDARIDSFQVTLKYLEVDYPTWQYNVRAHLHGNQYADQQTVAGAHYDDIIKLGDPYSSVPGANDNASGVALILELARVMAKNGYIPRGSINFVAFAAEEFDLQGSRFYVHDAEVHEDKILMMINNDMVAYEPSTKIPTWQMKVAYYSNSYSLLQEALSFCWRYSNVGPVIDNTNAKKSDSYAFFLGNQMALYFASRQDDPDYHTINDKSPRLNFDYCKEIAKVTCAMIVLKN
jgi:hypothetical protein